MKKMEEFSDNETLSNPIVELYQTMLLSRKDIDSIIQKLDETEKFNDDDMMHYNRFLVRLFAFAFAIDVPYYEIIVDKKNNYTHEFFVHLKYL